jgi:hypothetical protein
MFDVYTTSGVFVNERMAGILSNANTASMTSTTMRTRKRRVAYTFRKPAK